MRRSLQSGGRGERIGGSHHATFSNALCVPTLFGVTLTREWSQATMLR